MADKTYIINFKANVQGMDNVIQQFEKILNMDGLNLTEGMLKQWQQLKTMASSYIEQMNTELAKPQPDMAVLEQLDKRLTQITTKAINFSDALAKVVLPKDLSEKLTALQKKISDINEQTKQLNQKRFGNERKLNSKNESGLAQTEENRIFNKVNDDPVGIGNNVISSWRDFVNTVNELKTSGQLTGKQLEEVETIIKNTTSAMAIRKSEIEASVQADRDSIAANKQKVVALQQEISTLNSSDNAQDRLTAEQQEYLALIKQLSGAITQLRAQQINTTEEVERATNAQRQQNIAIQQSTTAQRKNTSVIGQAAKQVLTYGSIVGLLRRAYQTTISTIKEMDEALTGMAVVTSMSRQEAWAMAEEFENLAQATGLAVTEVANAATMFYQQGKSTTQVLELTEAAAKAAAIAGIDLTTSVDLLTNAMNGFQISANDAMEVSDKFAALAAAAATDYEELAIALSKVAAQANLAGMSMDFTLGMLTAGIEVTREAPETIGTALKTIIARMRELTDYGKTLEDGMDLNRVAAALDEIGVAMTDETGMMRDLEDVITEVGQKWDTLNKNQQANVAVAMAGTRQQSRFIAMMQDFERTQELVNMSANSYGATLAQHSKYMGGVEAATNNLTTAWQSFISALTGSDTIVNIMNIVTRLVDMADYLLNNLNLFPVLLGTIGVALLSQLSTRMTMFNMRKQEAQVQNQQLLLENQKKAVEAAAALEELKAVDTQIMKDKIRQKQEDLNSKTEIKNTKKEKLEQTKKNVEIEKEAILKDNSLTAQEKQQKIQKLELESQTEINKAQIEYENASREQAQAAQELQQAENELLDHQLNIKTQEYNLNVANNNILQTQLNSMGILGALINAVLVPLKMVQSVMTVVNTLQTIFIKLKKKEGQETDKNTRKTIKQSLAEKVKAAFSMAGSAAAIPVAGWVIAGVILATIIGLTIAATAATSNQASVTEKTTENLKEMQVELYELNNAASSVSSLADEFEELSNKIGKSNDELERMNEIVQQVNDTAGYTVVDISATPEEQAAQMRAYSSVQKQKTQGTLADMKDIIHYSAQWGMTESSFWTSLDQEQAYNILTNAYKVGTWDNKEYLNAYAEYMRNYDESFAASVRAIAEQEIEGLENIDNTELRNAILNASVDQFEHIFSIEDGFDFEKFNEVFTPEMLSELDNIYSSDSVADYAIYYHNLSDEQKTWLSESLPIFEMFESVTSETAQAFDDMGFSMQDVNTIFANLADNGKQAAAIFEKVVAEVDKMEFRDDNGELLKGEDELAAKRRKTFKMLAEENKKFALEANEVVMMSDTERQEAINKGNKMAYDYQEALIKLASAKEIAEIKRVAYERKKADGKSAGESDEQYQKKLTELEQELTAAQANVELAEDEVSIYKNATENATEKNKELAAELLDTEQTSNLVDNLTRLSSSMERLSKVGDVANLSFEEQRDILEDYPELIDSMQKGYLTAGDTIDLFKKKTDEVRQEIKNSIESIKSEINTLYGDYKKINLDGISFSRLFEDSTIGEELRDKVLGLSADEMLKLVKNQLGLTGNDAQEMANAISGAVKEFSVQSYFDAQIDEEGWTALLDPKALKELTDKYTKLNDEIERQDDLLGRFNEGSELYNETLEKRNRLIIESIKVGKDNREDLQKQIDQRFEGHVFKDKNGNVLKFEEIFNFETGLNKDIVDNLDQDSKGLIQQHSNFLQEMLDQDEEYRTEALDGWETLFESYTEQLTKETEELVEQLEARKEAYENYFDELDAMQEEEEYEQSRDSIIQQLQALSGGQDAASKQKIKELQAELNTLNEEQLQSQTEAQRDAILAELDSEIEIQNDLLDSIDTYLGQLIEIIANPDRTEDQTDWIYDVIKTLVPNITDNEIHNLLGFSEGGYVNYTGLAMVHGSPSSPEAFLSAQDTTNIRALLDALAMGQTVDTSSFNGIDNASNIIQIDEINIQTNELNTEQDFGNAGRALADEFAQAIQKRGINLNVKR